MNHEYDIVIGLEVHIQLNTVSKAFCGDDNNYGADPNTQISAISLAHPGTLPVVNKEQIHKAILLGTALGCRINQECYFDRKHYFYADSPKAYQITQDIEPICIGGSLTLKINNISRNIRIHHIHMEEDAGKTIHDIHPTYSLIDLNRAGTPLLELVTEPDISSPEEVYEFIAELQKLLRYLGVSDGDMEKGSMRADCNVSVKPKGGTILGTRCEIKNINSKKFAREAVAYEASRQIKMLENGQTFSKQTLHYNTSTGRTEATREKEDAEDYRYFPDPDLPPMVISDEELNAIRRAMPQLPWILKEELMSKHQFTDDYANQLTQTPLHVHFFEQLAEMTGAPLLSANLLINNLFPELQRHSIELEYSPIDVPTCVAYLGLIITGQCSASAANQQLWPALWSNPSTPPKALAESLQLIIKEDQNFLDELIQNILASNPSQLNEYRKGKKGLFGFFMGSVIRQASGADPSVLKQKLTEALDQA